MYKMIRAPTGENKGAIYGWSMKIEIDQPSAGRARITIKRMTMGYAPKKWKLWSNDEKTDLELETGKEEAIKYMFKFKEFADNIDLAKPEEYDMIYEKFVYPNF